MQKSPSGFSEKAIRGMTVQEIRSHVERLASDIHASNFALGGLVRRVRDEGLWRKWGGNTYPSFDDWCWGVLGFKESKAEGLARIYSTIQGAQITGGVKKKLVDLGWTKLRHLSRVIDEDNAEEWLNRASTLSARALDAEVRIAVGKQAGKGESFEGSDGEESKPRLKLEAFFDDEEDYRFVNRVLGIMERRTKTKSNGRLFGMMASAYLAQHNRDDEGGLPAQLEDHIKALERMYGVELMVKPPKKAQPIKAQKRGRKKGVKKSKAKAKR